MHLGTGIRFSMVNLNKTSFRVKWPWPLLFLVKTKLQSPVPRCIPL